MRISAFADAAALVAAVSAPVALAMLAVALLLVRDVSRARARARALEADNDRLQDEIWRAEEAGERYRGLVESQGDLIVRRGLDGTIRFANAAYAVVAGEQAEALAGRRFELVARETREHPAPGEGTRAWDQLIETPAGPRWISFIETPVRGPDGAPEVQAVGRDVTERHETERALAEAREKAEAANAAKGRFLAAITHELRTPLSGVVGMAGLLKETTLDPEQATYVRAIETSGEALLSLIDEILDFSKIEAGKVALAQEAFEPEALVEGVVELLAPRAQGKGIEIAGFVAPRVPRRVTGDPARLRQVLVNLAGNAVKFTEEGGVGLTLDVEGDGRLAFSVADTGPGIPAAKRAAIFEAFEQGDGSASTRHGGTGLGLAISRGIVRAMGGDIIVAGEPGAGAVFRFVLPLAALEPAAPVPRKPELAGLTALIVARSPFEAPFLAERLRAAGAWVDQAGGGAEAEAMMRALRPPQVVIVDAAIGEEPARALAAAAREAGVKRRFVMLSPFERRSFGPLAGSGFDGYLVKPLRTRSLMARLIDAPAGAAAAGEDPPPAPEWRLPEGFTVLVAEDDEVNALLATRLLVRAGARVMRARDGREAWEIARAGLAGEPDKHFDLALIDVRMPGLDGHEVARRIRAAESGRAPGRGARLVALTANAFPEDRAAAIGAGFDAFLVKPLRPDRLAALVRDDTDGPARAVA
jgi:PAS domain S-box-containing protein